MKKLTKLMITICTLLMITISCQTSVFALTKHGNVSDGTPVKITKHVALDSITFNGKTVYAYYKPRNGSSSYSKDSTYCCAAMVSRFFREVYGITVNGLIGNGTPNASKGRFVKTATPKAGDVFASNNHWAIVKKVSGNNVYLIEQNYWWNNVTNIAGKGRIVPLKGNHWYFRWTGIEVTKVTLNKTSATLNKNKTLALKATIAPSNATIKTITWTTSNASVATVNSSGLVTAKGPGTATITAKAFNGKSATCRITVPFNTTVCPASANADAGVVITYNNVADESGYQIQRSENNGAFKVIATVKANVTRYADTSAKHGKTYTYKVLPYRGSYYGSSSTTKIYRLATPVIHSASPAYFRKINLTWNKSAGSPTYYQIICKTGNYTKSIKVKTSSLKTSGGKYTYTISGLSYGKTYKITVTAINGNYKSNVSIEKSVKVTK